MAKYRNSNDRAKIKGMNDSTLAYTVNQYRSDLNEFGGTTEEWQFYKMMREECCQRFINKILYDY